ncbi:MAG TPA: GntR family transcriptional regulator [Usitatibacter sp.]|nr:GntR family transcriptional regulator [Usitatibacter sp.]
MSETAVSNLHRLPRDVAAQNLPGYVQQVLLEAILSRVLVPGERLLIDEIAGHFGISKIPVREAIKALEASGWLDSRPRRGTYVRSLSPSELQEVFEMRRVLEPFGARLAAERRTEAHLAELRELMAAGNEAIRARDLLETARFNSRFHIVVAQACGNAILSDTLQALQARIRRYYAEIDWATRRKSFAEHRQIYEALRDRDGEAAARITTEHVGHAWTMARNTLEPKEPQ